MDGFCSRYGSRSIRLFTAAFLGISGLQPPVSAAVSVAEASDTITLRNGIVTAVVNRRNAEILSVKRDDGLNLLNKKGVTFNASAFGIGKNETGINAVVWTIGSRGPEIADLTAFDPHFIFLRAEMHIVMRNGDSGVYEYLVLRHEAGDPAGNVGQLRWVFRGASNAITHAYASATKQGQMVPDIPGTTQIADATFRLPLGNAYHEATGHTFDGAPVYSKYDWSDCAEQHLVHGFSSEHEGIWMVQPSMEYTNGGPSKGILTVHNGPVCILEFLSGHFLMRTDSGIELLANQPWEQIIGPWLIYLNKGSSPLDLWRDAYQRGLQEKRAWPYAWVKETESLYPRNRGAVSGTLQVPGQKAANALIVLGASDRDWQVQSMRYLFWTRADADGRFFLPKVRPGSYALYAWIPGVVGELKIPSVTVAPGRPAALGTIAWNPPRREHLLWRLGIPDRSTAEFRFGSEMRQFGLWWRYLAERGTKNLDFTIGRSRPAQDWYYAQSVVALPDGSYFSPSWNIHFDLPAGVTGKLLLTVDLAGAAGGGNHLNILANGKLIGRIGSENDSGIYRSAVSSANFRHNVVEFDASALNPGANTISFQVASHHGWRSEKTGEIADQRKMPELPPNGVMYDCVQLEAGPVVSDGSYALRAN